MGDGDKSGRASRRRKIDIWRVACLGGKVTAQSPVWLEPRHPADLWGHGSVGWAELVVYILRGHSCLQV